MRSQQGVTLIGLIFFLALGTIVALIAFRLVPFYVDFFTMRSMLQNIATEKRDAPDRELRKDFEMRAVTNYLSAYRPSALEINRDQGRLTLSVHMTDKKALVGGVSLLMELDAQGSAILK
jgi:hypothetical protein